MASALCKLTPHSCPFPNRWTVRLCSRLIADPARLEHPAWIGRPPCLYVGNRERRTSGSRSRHGSNYALQDHPESHWARRRSENRYLHQDRKRVCQGGYTSRFQTFRSRCRATKPELAGKWSGSLARSKARRGSPTCWNAGPRRSSTDFLQRLFIRFRRRNNRLPGCEK